MQEQGRNSDIVTYPNGLCLIESSSTSNCSPTVTNGKIIEKKSYFDRKTIE